MERQSAVHVLAIPVPLSSSFEVSNGLMNATFIRGGVLFTYVKGNSAKFSPFVKFSGGLIPLKVQVSICGA